MDFDLTALSALSNLALALHSISLGTTGTPRCIPWSTTSATTVPRKTALSHTLRQPASRAIRYTTPLPSITQLVVHELCTATAAELVPLLRASGSTLEHLTLRFVPFADAQPVEKVWASKFTCVRHKYMLLNLPQSL